MVRFYGCRITTDHGGGKLVRLLEHHHSAARRRIRSFFRSFAVGMMPSGTICTMQGQASSSASTTVVVASQAPFCSQTRYASNNSKKQIRLSKLLSQYHRSAMSRREAERLIRRGEVSIAGQIVTQPQTWISLDQLLVGEKSSSIQISGKPLLLENQDSEPFSPRVWLVHKLSGEVVEEDPQGQRPSLMQRLRHGGIQKQHLKPIGRLDMFSEGLVLVTTCGHYAREMELPSNQLHRTYRVRLHGVLSDKKLKLLRRGITLQDIRYPPMQVKVDKPQTNRQRNQPRSNHWLHLITTHGQHHSLRIVLKHLGLQVSRLIRIGFGDYHLHTIPPGMALEVPVKHIHQRRGILPFLKKRNTKIKQDSRITTKTSSPPVTWIHAADAATVAARDVSSSYPFKAK